MSAKEGQHPDWDEEFAKELIGAIVLVGITYTDPQGETESQAQYFGMVASAHRDEGIAVECHGHFAGETCVLPPQTEAFTKAKPGVYRLRSTGEEVVDPDYVTSWTMQRPARD